MNPSRRVISKMGGAVALGLLLVAPSMWAQTEKDASAQLAAARSGITDTNRRAIEAAKAKDVEGAAAVYTDDAIMMPPGEKPVIGRDAIVAFIGKMHSGDGVLADQTIETVDVAILADGIAVETAYFHGTVRTPGKPDSGFKGKSLIVYKRQPNGSWKMFRDMWEIL